MNRIVLLRRRNAPCPEELTETLKGLWHSVEEVRDTLNALAAVCVVVRSERPRITLGLEPDNRVAFVYSDLEWADDPESGIPELLAFLRKRLPTVSLWNVSGEGLVLEVGTPPPTTGADASSPAGRQADPDETPDPGAGTSGYGTLRLAGGYGPGEEDAPSSTEADPTADEAGEPGETTRKNPEESNPGRARAELTSEELEMLRDDDPGQQHGPVPERDGPEEARE